MNPSIDESTLNVLAREALQGLYAISTIEIVYALTDAHSVKVAGAFKVLGLNQPSQLVLPAGHYLILKIVDPPTIFPGIAAVVSPLPAGRGDGGGA